MELASSLQPSAETSPLASLRLQRRLPTRELAARSGLTEEQIEWLEQGRIYRFPTGDAALVALLLYATALGVDHSDARKLAGLAVGPRPLRANPASRLAVLGALTAALIALVGALVLPNRASEQAAAERARAEAALPPPWRIDVDVLNGAGDINWTRALASRIGGMAYRIHRVGKADRFDYRQTVVFYEPGGQGVGFRLARQLGVRTRPLPGGKNPNRVVVVVGPRKGPG